MISLESLDFVQMRRIINLCLKDLFTLELNMQNLKDKIYKILRNHLKVYILYQILKKKS